MVSPEYRSTAAAFSAALLILFLCAQSMPAATDGASVQAHRPDLSDLVRRITQVQMENHNRSVAYSVTREYKVFGPDAARARTEVVASVNFLPPNVKSYDIEHSTGGMGEKVIRRVLDHEVNVTRDPRTMMVSDQNYVFDYYGEDIISGVPCYRLTITPKHDRKDLLKATIWVEKSGYRIVRIEGEPAKSPSFWVKDVHVVLNFEEVAGMWLQTETHAMAHLRFGGEYNLVSHDLDYDVTRAVALKTPRRRHASAMIAAGVR